MLAVTCATNTWSARDDIKMRQTQHRSVQPVMHTITVPPYGNSTTSVVGHLPRLANKPVEIKIEYARPINISAAVRERSNPRRSPNLHVG
jgi:hypothetical protein